MVQLIARLTATIGNGASLSDALALHGNQVAVIEMPTTWTAAVLTFQSSVDGTNYFNLYDDAGNEVVVEADATRRIHVDVSALSQHKYIKLRSGTSAVAVNQGGARTIYVEVWS